MHKMRLTDGPFQKIAAGKKSIECRLFDAKRQLIRIGDRIEFSPNDFPEKKLITRVAALHRASTFAELFFKFPPEVFGGDSAESLLREIESFYSPDEEARWGVVGIEVEREEKSA